MAAVTIASSPGVWRFGFAGMTGLDWQAAALLHDDKASWPETRELLRSYEAGALAGAAARAKREKKGGGDD